MDLAYDHILEQSYQDRAKTPTQAQQTSNDVSTTVATAESSTTASNVASIESTEQPTGLQAELQDTLRAFQSSAWGSRLGGLWGNVQSNVQKQTAALQKQGQDLYVEARKEIVDLGKDIGTEAQKIQERVVEVGSGVGRGRSATVKANPSTESAGGQEKEVGEKGQELDTEGFLERFKAEAAKRLKDIQHAEDAADEALLRFGTNIRNFLKEAVAVTAPEIGTGVSEILFESKDASGKRVIHTNRMDAQLHVIHTTPKSFTEDPETEGDQYQKFKSEFDIEKKTDDIAKELERYHELRSSMEKLVPETVEYKDFWTRYYFLRHVVESQEEKRREMLKAPATAEGEEEVAWDEDSDSESEPRKATPRIVAHKTNESSTTIHQTTIATNDGLKPAESRRSHDEKSVADSEASYDVVSGATSQAAGSPKDKKKDESDDEDWE